MNPANTQTRLEYADILATKFHDPQAALTLYRTALLDYDDRLPKDEPKRLSAERRQAVEAKIAKLATELGQRL